MTTPVHLSGARPSTAGTQSAAQANNASAAPGQGNAQAALFDLLFAMQLGAGGWEATATETAVVPQEEAPVAEPASAALPAAPIGAPTNPEIASADPAALLWNPFNERVTPDAKLAPGNAGETASATTAIGTADGKDSGKGTDRTHAARAPLAAGLDPAEDAQSGDTPVAGEYSQHAAAQSEGQQSADAAPKVQAGQNPPAVQQNTPTPAPVASASLDAPIGTPAFREQLSAQIAVFIDQKQLSAQIQVHPPELGPVDVQIKLNVEHVEVDFFATQADARQAIENAIPRLKEMLAEQGLSLGNAHVGTQDDPRAFAGTLDHGGGWQSGARQMHGTARDEHGVSADLAPPAPGVTRHSLRLVDTFA